MNTILPVRGFLLHITHYDPTWCMTKETETPFDLHLGLDVIDCMASVGLNLVMIDCGDGLIYASHPELTRHYSQSLKVLQHLVQRAKHHNIEVVPLLNFAQSGVFQNNHWFRPHHKLFDNEEYWHFAFEIIDELLQVIQPPRFFHIGMDEDHWRSHRQYIQAIETLHSGLAKRHLQTIIWNATALRKAEFEVFKEKSLVAEKAIPNDVIQVVFDYVDVQPEIFERLRNRKFPIWGAPGDNPSQVETMRDVLLKYNGQGILLTRWIPCIEQNRDGLLNYINRTGLLCS
ncbi:MAG: hypothetical protein JW934_22995 [Anaerolineae bacterium]|nr:hypothetical protein [Anaerolineae bacterium]